MIHVKRSNIICHQTIMHINVFSIEKRFKMMMMFLIMIYVIVHLVSTDMICLSDYIWLHCNSKAIKYQQKLWLGKIYISLIMEFDIPLRVRDELLITNIIYSMALMHITQDILILWTWFIYYAMPNYQAANYSLNR